MAIDCSVIAALGLPWEKRKDGARVDVQRFERPLLMHAAEQPIATGVWYKRRHVYD